MVRNHVARSASIVSTPTLFRLSSQHAIVIDENAEKSVYDRDAFRTVVTTVANAPPGTEMKL
jgi:hypothetical protein